MCTIPALRRVCRESYNDPLAVYDKLEAARHGPGHGHRSRFHRCRREPAFPPRFLPQRRGHLYAAQRQSTARRRLRHHRTRPHRTAAPTQRFRIAVRVAGGSRSVLQRQSRLLRPDRAAFHRRFPLCSKLPFPRSKRSTAICWRSANANAAALADRAARAEVGGSDAHAMATRRAARGPWFPAPATDRNICSGLRRGMGRVRGETGGYRKLTRDVFSIGREMVRENPATLPIAVLGWMVPFILLHNYPYGRLFSHAGGWHDICNPVR